MNIQITGENIEINEEMKTLVEKKLYPALERHLRSFEENIQIVSVKIKKHENKSYTVSINLELPGKEHVFADNTQKTLTSAMTGLKEEVVKQIEKYKGKLRDFSTDANLSDSV